MGQKASISPCFTFCRISRDPEPKIKKQPHFWNLREICYRKSGIGLFFSRRYGEKKPCKDYDAIHEPVPTAHAQTGERARLPSPSGGKIQC